jgi:hypothetical protein
MEQKHIETGLFTEVISNRVSFLKKTAINYKTARIVLGYFRET